MKDNGIAQHELLARLADAPDLRAATLDWLLGTIDATAWEPQLDQAARQLLQLLPAKRVVVIESRSGELWEQTRAGGAAAVPERVTAEVLDRDLPFHAQDWSAAPLSPRLLKGWLLAVQRGDAPPPAERRWIERVDAAAAAVGALLLALHDRRDLVARLRRLQAVVQMVAKWNQQRETEQLLSEMARTSTELFGAERASIFLWDRTRHELVGRPALGVDQGELRVPDDRGVVGRVVQQGLPLLVDDREANQWVDRRVDQQLGFHTRNLLCVPLKNQRGIILGAFELINKRHGTFTQDDLEGLMELAQHAALAIENSQHIEQLLAARRQMAEAAAAELELIGQTPVIDQVRATVRRVAQTDLAVLVLGENGTGKEVVSRLVHYWSARRDQPFVAVNCAALTETLMESELFGHEKGAFTDAHDTKRGKFEVASGGTIFLDEIGDLSPGGQAKLLRVLEDKTVVRVGGSTPISVDTRVIAATNQDLASMVKAKKFRQDLYFRLNVVSLTLPPLRDRSDDVLVLAEHFLQQFCLKARRPRPEFSTEAKRRLKHHRWPGNVRELRNLMERLAYLHTGETIEAADLAFILAPPTGQEEFDLGDAEPLSEATRLFQVQYIRRQIAAAQGNVTDAARRLGLHRSNLYRKMRQLKMNEADDFVDEEE